MAELSPDDKFLIEEHPLASSLDNLCGLLRGGEKTYKSCHISSDGSLDQLYQNALSKLLHALQGDCFER